MNELFNHYRTKLIDGKLISSKIESAIRAEVSTFRHKPKLAIVLASDDESSVKYIELKAKKAKELGMDTDLFYFSKDHKKEDIVHQIKKFKSNDAITGVLIQLPFYPHLEKYTSEIVNALDPIKDMDGLTSSQQGDSSHFLPSSVPPATVEAILECFNAVADEDLTWESLLINYRRIDFFKGKTVLIVNNSDLIGKPLAQILSSLDATVIIANDKTKDLASLARVSDIVVSATGKTGIFDHKVIMEGAILIDVTSTKVGNEVLGDFIISKELLEKVSYITPVPGGVGPLTVACLLRNIVRRDDPLIR